MREHRSTRSTLTRTFAVALSLALVHGSGAGAARALAQGSSRAGRASAAPLALGLAAPAAGAAALSPALELPPLAPAAPLHAPPSAEAPAVALAALPAALPAALAAAAPAVLRAPASLADAPAPAPDALSAKAAAQERLPASEAAAPESLLGRLSALGRALPAGSAALNPAYDNSRARAAADEVSAAGRARARRPALAAPAAARPGRSAAEPPAAAPRAGGPALRYAAAAALIAGAAVYLAVPVLPLAALAGSLVLSILAHEVGHLWAVRDPARASARDLNPLRHVDPVGTLLLPAASLVLSLALTGVPVFIGWTRHVHAHAGPEDRTGPARAALAGPALNLVLGLAALPLLAVSGGTAAVLLGAFAQANLALALFNLLPAPWLDGGKLLLSGTLSARAYEKWIADARLHHLEDLHPVLRALLIGAIGAAAIPLFALLGLPLLFLALPCGFDYWCIREKVRSEKAVQNMMDLMGQWGALLAQIAEEQGLSTEVDAGKAELAMVYSVDHLLEKLMEREDFRALSDEDKISRFLREFPDYALPVLKQHVFTEDSEEAVRRVLADPRNQPFMERLKRWLANPDGDPEKVESIFAKMASPHAKKKFQDAVQEKTRRAGGTPASGLLPLALFAIPTLGAVLAEPLFGWIAALLAAGGFLLMAGTARDRSSLPEKLSTFDNGRDHIGRLMIWVRAEGQDAARRVLLDLGYVPEQVLHSPQPVTLFDQDAGVLYRADMRLETEDGTVAAVRRLAESPAVEEIRVHPDLVARLQQDAPAGPVVIDAAPAAAPSSKIRVIGRPGSPDLEVFGILQFWVRFRSAEEANVLIERRALDSSPAQGSSDILYRFRFADLQHALAELRALESEEGVEELVIAPTLADYAESRGANPAAEEHAQAPAPAKAKILAAAAPSAGTLSEGMVWVEIQAEDEAAARRIAADAGLAPQAARVSRSQNQPMLPARPTHFEVRALADTRARAGLAANRLARRDDVTKVVVHPKVHALFHPRRPALDAPADLERAPSPHPKLHEITGPEWSGIMIVTQNREFWVEFDSAESARAVSNWLGLAHDRKAEGPRHLYRFQFPDQDQMTARLRELADDARVRSLVVSPSIMEHLKPNWSRLAAAPAFDESRAVLVQFKAGSPADARTAYADALGLRPVEADHGGVPGRVLYELPRAVEPLFFLATLQDDAADAASPVQGAWALREPAPAPEEEPVPEDPAAKLSSDGSIARPDVFRVRFKTGDRAEAQEAVGRAGTALAGARLEWGEDGWLTVAARGLMKAMVGALALARDAFVRAVALHPQAHALAAGKAPAAAAAAPRNPAAEWFDYLSERKTVSGKTLDADQAQFLARFLAPVHADPNSPLPPLIGRLDEIKRALPVLLAARGKRTSVLLTGLAGVGKTAIAEGIAQIFADVELAALTGAGHMDLARYRGRKLVRLDVSLLLEQEKPAEALRLILKLVKQLNDADPRRGNEVVLFIDEFHRMRAFADQLKDELHRGAVSVLGATTDDEYKKFIEEDAAWERRMKEIRVEELDVQETIRVLRGLKSHLEHLREADIPDEVLVAAAKLAHQFDKAHQNPDKAINAVVETAEEARPDNLRAALSLDLRDSLRELADAAREAARALTEEGHASALALPVERYNDVALLAAKIVAFAEARAGVKDGRGSVTLERLKAKIAKDTGIESGQLTLGEEGSADKYVNMETEIGKDVVGQDEAIFAMAEAVRRNKAGLGEPGKPIAKYIWLGPTGVGKTYLAKMLAKFLFNDEKAMLRLDMSEYTESHHADRLGGSPPGYVGHEDGGQLTEFVRRRPYSVVLVDEMEKAHPRVWDNFLQILDDGRYTDSKGRVVDFSNTIIIFSSNLGMSNVDSARYEQRLKEAADDAEREKIQAEWDAAIEAAVEEAIGMRFRPEFVNRFDRDPATDKPWVIFNRLREHNVKVIAKLQMKQLQERLRERHGTELDFTADKAVIDQLVKIGFSAIYGARPMQAAINNHIVSPLARWILGEVQGGRDPRGQLVKVVVGGDGKFGFEASPKPAAEVARTPLEGPAQRLANEVFDLIEGMAAGPALEPTPELLAPLLDGLLREAAEPAPAAPSVFHPDVPAPIVTEPVAIVSADELSPTKADPTVRLASRRAADSAAAAGWDAKTAELLSLPAGTPGEGWLKAVTRHAKTMAQRAGSPERVRLAGRVDGERIVLKVSSAHVMSPAERAMLAAHFGGTPPADYRAAQAKADSMSPSGGSAPAGPFEWDHNLLDLHRRVAAAPGARFGYSGGPSGTEYWLELRRAPEAAEPAADEQAKKLFLGVVLQEGLTSGEQDGPAIRTAAAEGYAGLADASDLPLARRWIRANGWASAGLKQSSLQEKWPLVMLTARILQRFGTPRDLPVLEALARTFIDTSHIYVPARMALVEALAEAYVRAGREAAVAAAASDASQVKEAARKALGRIGAAEDLALVQDDAEALYRLASRHEAIASRLLEDWPPSDARWKTYNTRLSEPRRIAILRLVGERGDPERDIPALLSALRGGNMSVERVLHYSVAQAFADLTARGAMTQGMGDAIARFTDRRSMTRYDDTDHWPKLLAMVYAAGEAGGPDVLSRLEDVMKENPGGLQSVYEQPYFDAPQAWAQALVRNGLFAEYARPQPGPDGAPGPSKLQRMLASRDKPMLVAAALRAIALARAGYGRRPRRAAPALPFPDPDPRDGRLARVDTLPEYML